MNPAWSVITFTVLAGAAQGLVVVLAAAVLAQARLPAGYAGTGLWTAFALLAGGLAASFLHLGRPERAWRAAAMWRTSWLSREVIVLPALAAVVLAWALLGARAPAVLAALAVAALLLALLLWWCTAMIYACLRFVQEWAHPLTIANFAAAGMASGAVLAAALAALRGEAALAAAIGGWALAATAVAGVVRWLVLRRNAGLKPKSTLQSATGIRGPRVVQMAMGMTGGSFNTREFFHGRTLAVLRNVKLIFALTAYALPATLLLWALAGSAPAAFVAAALVQLPGLFAERWFFFAQARHPQNLYYQVVG